MHGDFSKTLELAQLQQTTTSNYMNKKVKLINEYTQNDCNRICRVAINSKKQKIIDQKTMSEVQNYVEENLYN